MAAQLAGPAGDKRFHIEQNAEINVTPFVDVMLVLLIIFMVAAPLASVAVKLDLPPAETKPTTTPPQPIYISIKPDGRMYLMNDRATLEELPGGISKLVKDRSDPTKERIYIRADKETQYGAFMDVLVVLQDAGYYKVSLIGLDTNAKAHQGSLS